MKNLYLLLLCTLIYNLSIAQSVWKEDSFEDFIDGRFDDAGANMYVSHRGNIQTSNRWDINGDGHVDILCVNSHPLVEMLDMSIYWGNGKDFSIKNHSYIPANGPMWVTPGDLNDDGEIDLVVANYSNGTWTEMVSYIYYGGLKEKNNKPQADEFAHYPFKQRVALPGSNAQKSAIGDLNKDGYQDIVFAFSGGFWEYRNPDKQGTSPSRIYWGSENGFDPEQHTNLATMGATDVLTHDLNNDGWLDIVFANGDGKESYIYFGGEGGFVDDKLQTVPTMRAHAVETGDVNNDGSPDLVFANQAGSFSRAYLNQNGIFATDNFINYETHSAKDVVISDFNKDGYADVFFTNHQHSLSGNPKLANRLIDSYLYFGSESGFSNTNRQSIRTIGAWGANAADLNKDGWVDLLVCNFQEHYSYEVPSFVYWNGPEGFSTTKRTPLYEHGAQGNAIADFDGDGNLDILITSMMGNSRGDYDPNYLYFGSEKGDYSISNRLELPGREAYEQAFADLDEDGQVDLLLLNRGEIVREANEVWIYWNDNNEFDPWRISGLPSYGGLGVEIADLDKDGYLDILIANGKSDVPAKEGPPSPGSFIYWGGPEGWPVTERTNLPLVWVRSPSIADMNGDGHLDLVFGQQQEWGEGSIYYGDGTRNFREENRIRINDSKGTGSPGVADLNKDGLLDIAFAHNKNVLIYYQKQDGTFTEVSRVAVQAKTMCVADVNQDGWQDLICPFYKGNGKRSDKSTILLGGGNGYSLENSIQLPTDGATGSIVSDFNRDGYQDIFFFCHRHDGSYDKTGKFGDHRTNSKIYWGSSAGFDDNNFLAIPSIGVHYDVGIDLGHIVDRTFIYEYISSPYQTGNKKVYKINWQADTPFKSTVKFQLRSAISKDELDQAIWRGPEGLDSYYSVSGSELKDLEKNDWIQYRVLFDTDNGAYSPVLYSVEIHFE
jgi:hypothetical protein